MKEIEEVTVCRAPAIEVWKLLHDPVRFTEWWTGITRAEPTPEGAALYTEGRPATGIPTRVTSGRDGNRVVINCLVTHDVYTWILEPHPEGCRVTVRIAVADDEERLSARRAGVVASLPRLVAAAESTT